MLLNGMFVGMSLIPSGTLEFIKHTYDKVTLYGNAIFDKVWIRNIAEDDAYFDAITQVLDYQPVWDSDTVFLADFEGDLLAGNIQASGDILSWIVNRKVEGSTIYEKVDEVDYEVTELMDYKVPNGETVSYQILPITTTEVAEPLETEVVASDYSGWFIIDETTETTFHFNVNLQSGSITADEDQTEFTTFNKYNTVSQGSRNFVRGQVSAVVPEELTCDGQLIQSSEFITSLQNFVNNGNKKILKNRKGDIWYVMTKGFARNKVNDNIREQVDSVTFNFVEVEAI